MVDVVGFGMAWRLEIAEGLDREAEEAKRRGAGNMGEDHG